MATSNHLQQGEVPAESHGRAPREKRTTVRINGRFLLLLSVVALVLGAGFYGLHAFQMKRNAATYLDLAKEAEANGRTTQAVEYLTQYLRFRPKDYDAKLCLANLIEPRTLDRRAHQRVLTLLEDVLRNDPERAGADEIRRRVVDLSLFTGNPRNALGYLQVLREKRPKDAELIFLEGRCHNGLSEHGKAVERFLSAISMSVETIEYYEAAISTLQARPQSLPSRESLESLSNPRIAPELIALFPSRKARPKKKGKAGQPDGKATVLTAQTAVAGLFRLMLRDGEPEYLAHLARAGFALSDGDLQAAETDVVAARKLAPDAPEVLLQSAAIELTRAGRFVQAYEPQDRIRARLDSAQRYAARGRKLKSPDNLPFFSQLVRIAILRAEKSSEDPGRRAELLAAAEENIKAGLKACDGYADSPPRKSFDDLRGNLNRKRDLLGLYAELLLQLARRDDGTLDAKTMKRHTARIAALKALGGARGVVTLSEAMALVAGRQWRPALEKLAAARRQLDSTTPARRRIDLALAECYWQLRDVEGRIGALKRGLEAEPRWVRGRYRLAEALAAQGKLDAAIREYRRLIFDYRRGQFALPYLRLRVRKIGTLPPAQRSAALSQIESNIGELEEQLRREKRDTSPIAVLRTQVLLHRGIPAAERYSRATKLLDDAIRAKPDNSGLRVLRAEIEARFAPGKDRAARAAAALAQLEAAVVAATDAGDRAGLLAGRAVIAARLPAEQCAAKLKAVVAGVDQLPVKVRHPVLESAARAYATVGRIDDARAIWKRLATAMPNNLGVRIAAARLAAVQNDAAGLAAEVAAIRRIEGDAGAWGHYFEARREIVLVEANRRALQKELPALSGARQFAKALAAREDDEKRLQRARSLLTYATQLQPRRADLYHALGRVELLRGNQPEAFRRFEQAILLGDRSERALTFAANYLTEKGDFARADEILQSAAGSTLRLDNADLSDGSGSLGLLAIDAAFRRKDFVRARSYVAANAAGFRAELLRARIAFVEYQSLTDADKSGARGRKLLDVIEENCRKAVTPDGKTFAKTPEPYVFAVYRLNRIGRTKAAERTIAAAARNLPENVRAVTAARCYAMLGDAKKAEADYLNAIKQQPGDAGLRLRVADFYARRKEYNKAGTQLEIVLGPKFAATNAQRAAARRLKVVLRAAPGSYADLQAALNMLPRPELSGLDDLATRVTLLQRSRLKRDRRELIGVMERLNRVRRLTVENRFRLARLYAVVDRWDDACEVMDELLEADPRNARFLAWYSLASLNHDRGTSADDVRRARDLHTRLRAVMPGSPQAAEMRARLLVHDKKPAEAGMVLLAAAERLIDKKMKLPPAQLAAVRQLALLCENLGLNAPKGAAEQLFERQAELSQTPEDVLLLASYYGRRGRYAEGLKVCRDAQKTCKPLAVAVAAANVVSRGRPSPADLATADQLVQSALKADPKSVRLKLISIGLLTASGRLARAEDEYREVLRKSPDHVTVLNNLAWLLAMQGKDLREAQALIDRAIARAGRQSVLLDTRGIVLAKSGQTREAVEELRRALEELDDPEVYLHLAQAQLAAGDRKAAAASLAAAHRRGLAVANLHRLEQPGYQAVANSLGLKTQ